MGRKNQNTFIKKQKEERKRKKKQEKQEKKEERKSQSTGGSLDEMIAYVDEYGNIVDEPPEETPPKKGDQKND